MKKKELKKIIKEDRKNYFDNIGIKFIYRKITHYPFYQIGKYIIICRKAGYYRINNTSFINKLFCLYYYRRKNILGEKLNIDFGPNEFGRRLKIYHGNIIVNGYAKIGDDCQLYGSNCIGNKGTSYDLTEAPIIGSNVSIGVGSKVIGNVNICNNVSISSLSLINKNISEENSLYGGIPAKLIKKYNKEELK